MHIKDMSMHFPLQLEEQGQCFSKGKQKTFSPTTITSSTTIPKTKINEKSDNKLIDTSNPGNINNAPNNNIRPKRNFR